MFAKRRLFLCCTRVVRKIITSWKRLTSRMCWSTVLWCSCSKQNFIQDAIQIYFSNWKLQMWCFPIQIQAERYRDCWFILFMIYVQFKQRKSFPLHYANAQSQLDGGLYHCIFITVDSVLLWCGDESDGARSSGGCLKSPGWRARRYSIVYAIVYVPSCYLHKRPGPKSEVRSH